MVNLTKKQRKVQRDYLNRVRNRLIKQGAKQKDVRSLLGGLNFSGLSDTKLNSLYNKAKNKPVPMVVNNSIVSREYVKKLKAWYGSKYNKDLVSNSYQQNLKSTLNNFKSVKEIYAHKRERDKKAKNRYINHLETLLDKIETSNTSKNKIKGYKKIISRIKRFNREDFKKFVVSDYSSKVDFDTIFLIDSPTNATDSEFNEFDFKGAKDLFNDLDRFSKQFLAAKKRR